MSKTHTRSKELFEKAVRLMPGGVNSPVRAYKSVGIDPRFVHPSPELGRDEGRVENGRVVWPHGLFLNC